MKKIFLIVILVFSLILTGCYNDYDECCYDINYVEEYNNATFIINTLEDLQKFYNDYKEIFGLDYIKKYDINGFYDIYDKYDSVNFWGEGNRLVIIILNEGYDATKHRLISVTYSEETATVKVECSIPGLNSAVEEVCGACLMVIEVSGENPSFDSVEINRVIKK